MASPTQSTVQNPLLFELAFEGFDRLCPQLELVELAYGRVLIEPNQPMSSVYFPEAGIASYLVPLAVGCR